MPCLKFLVSNFQALENKNSRHGPRLRCLRVDRETVGPRRIPEARTAFLQEMGALSAKPGQDPGFALRCHLRPEEIRGSDCRDRCRRGRSLPPPPVSDFPLQEARKAWPNTVIWVNFPETIFWSGAVATKQYTAELLKSAAPGDKLVLGFTEMGTWGATDDATECYFKSGTLAVMDAIEEMAITR